LVDSKENNMALYDDLQEINLGNVVNDGTGDDLRTALKKLKLTLNICTTTVMLQLVLKI